MIPRFDGYFERVKLSAGRRWSAPPARIASGFVWDQILPSFSQNLCWRPRMNDACIYVGLEIRLTAHRRRGFTPWKSSHSSSVSSPSKILYPPRFPFPVFLFHCASFQAGVVCLQLRHWSIVRKVGVTLYAPKRGQWHSSAGSSPSNRTSHEASDDFHVFFFLFQAICDSLLNHPITDLAYGMGYLLLMHISPFSLGVAGGYFPLSFPNFPIFFYGGRDFRQPPPGGDSDRLRADVSKEDTAPWVRIVSTLFPSPLTPFFNTFRRTTSVFVCGSVVWYPTARFCIPPTDYAVGSVHRRFPPSHNWQPRPDSLRSMHFADTRKWDRASIGPKQCNTKGYLRLPKQRCNLSQLFSSVTQASQ